MPKENKKLDLEQLALIEPVEFNKYGLHLYLNRIVYHNPQECMWCIHLETDELPYYSLNYWKESINSRLNVFNEENALEKAIALLLNKKDSWSSGEWSKGGWTKRSGRSVHYRRSVSYSRFGVNYNRFGFSLEAYYDGPMGACVILLPGSGEITKPKKLIKTLGERKEKNKGDYYNRNLLKTEEIKNILQENGFYGSIDVPKNENIITFRYLPKKATKVIKEYKAESNVHFCGEGLVREIRF